MKTTLEVKNEIEKNRIELKEYPKDIFKSKHNKITKEIKRLYSMQLYLETNPKEEFIKADLKRLRARKKNIDEGFAAWLENYIPSKVGANKKSIYRKEMGLKDIEAQIKNLSYLLS